MVNIKTEDATNIIREELLNLLPDLNSEKDKVEYFLKSIQPEIDQALASGDLKNLGFLKDRLIGRTSRISLGLIQREKVKVIQLVSTVLRSLVRQIV